MTDIISLSAAETNSQIIGNSTEQITGLDILSRRRYGLTENDILSTKTWDNFDNDPWVFSGSSGRLGEVNDIVVTLVRPSSGQVYCTVAFDKTSHGWRCRPYDDGPKLSLEIKNSRNGVLWTWLMVSEVGADELNIQCGWNNHRYAVERNVGRDIYADAAAVSLYKSAGTWRRC